jgi:hypothetical protein
MNASDEANVTCNMECAPLEKALRKMCLCWVSFLWVVPSDGRGFPLTQNVGFRCYGHFPCVYCADATYSALNAH